MRTAHLSQQTPLVVEVGPGRWLLLLWRHIMNIDCMCVYMHIGPGLLTRSILDTGVKRIAAIEKDERFLPTLTVCRQAGAGQ